jgi:hypothetical protein
MDHSLPLYKSIQARHPNAVVSLTIGKPPSVVHLHCKFAAYFTRGTVIPTENLFYEANARLKDAGSRGLRAAVWLLCFPG